MQSIPWPSCRSFFKICFLLALLFISGCARDEQLSGIEVSDEAETDSGCGNLAVEQVGPQKGRRLLASPDSDEPLDTSLQPEPATKNLTEQPLPAKGRTTKECYQRNASVAKQTKKKIRRCEPQSLPFARCRSGILNSCCLGGENGPLTWFACEKKEGDTSLIPQAGSILILAANKHNMPTGHVAFVEKVVQADPPTYRLIFSHTNYDRQCSLETDIEATYNSDTKTLDIFTGAWKDWGKGLPVAGFILR
jgi:hypothetical protein